MEEIKTLMMIDKIAEALAKAQAKMTNPPKTKTADCGKRGRYMYADLADVLDHVRVPLTENGLSIIQMVEPGRLVTRLVHSSGQYFESVYPLPQSAPDAQAMGSAITYARRYSLCPMLGIAGETDDDAQGARDSEAEKREAEESQKREDARRKMEEAKKEGRLRSAHTGEVIKPDAEKPADPAPDKPQSDPCAGINKALAKLMDEAKIKPDVLAEYAKRHLGAVKHPKDFPASYVENIVRPDNWAKLLVGVEKMKGEKK